MADEKPIIKLQFAPTQTSPTLEIGHGEYSRKFDVKDYPFECEPDEAKWLLKTGHFVEVPAESQSAKGDEKLAPPASAPGSKKASGTKSGEAPAAESGQ